MKSYLITVVIGKLDKNGDDLPKILHNREHKHEGDLLKSDIPFPSDHQYKDDKMY